MTQENEFNTQLTALRLLLQKEHSLTDDRKYLSSIYKDVRPVVITIDDFLRGNGVEKEEIRETRLAILSYILKKEVKSTYDLTLYQCATISHFLREKDEQTGEYYTPARAKRFLEACKDRAESKADVTARQNQLLKELGFEV